MQGVQAQHPATQATLDMDATLIETHKRPALYCYKHFKAYQPLNTWWAEQGLIVHSEFRDGTGPAGHEQVRVLEEAARLLPAGVTKLYLRSDTAAYQQDLGLVTNRTLPGDDLIRGSASAAARAKKRTP